MSQAVLVIRSSFEPQCFPGRHLFSQQKSPNRASGLNKLVQLSIIEGTVLCFMENPLSCDANPRQTLQNTRISCNKADTNQCPQYTPMGPNSAQVASSSSSSSNPPLLLLVLVLVLVPYEVLRVLVRIVQWPAPRRDVNFICAGVASAGAPASCAPDIGEMPLTRDWPLRWHQRASQGAPCRRG